MAEPSIPRRKGGGINRFVSWDHDIGPVYRGGCWPPRPFLKKKKKGERSVGLYMGFVVDLPHHSKRKSMGLFYRGGGRGEKLDDFNSAEAPKREN